MKPLKSVVSSGKLRASWGLTGNNRVGEYDTYALYQILKDKVGDFISLVVLQVVYIRLKTV